MMVVDSSAIIAILADEPEAPQFAQAIADAAVCKMSAASVLETGIVIEARHGISGGDKLDQLISAAQIRIEPVTVEQAIVARIAYRSYGKSRHPAGLNFGDCFTYALAKTLGEPILFKGADFSQTDIESVLSS